MECQRSPGPIRLTDQALVAVTLARQHAAVAGRVATVADLVLGLSQEPDGSAGRVLRQRESAVVALARHPLPPRLAPLDVALSWAADDAVPRPACTLDLLAAAVEAGGAELADVLDTVGLPASDLLPEGREADGGSHERQYPGTETVGFDPRGGSAAPLTLDAALAVARTRAVAGGAVALLLAVAHGPQAEEPGQRPLPGREEVAEALGRVRARGEPERAGTRWDPGLAAVLHAARVWRGEGRVSAADLVRAAVLAGGEGPGAVLDEADASRSR